MIDNSEPKNDPCETPLHGNGSLIRLVSFVLALVMILKPGVDLLQIFSRSVYMNFVWRVFAEEHYQTL